MCCRKWQWKSQFPSRSGTQVRLAVVNPCTSSVTAHRRAAGAYTVSRAGVPRASTRK